MDRALGCLAFALAACVASEGPAPSSGTPDAGPAPDTTPRDSAAPIVELSEPIRGAFVDAAEHPTLRIAGTVTDDTEVQSVCIDGRRVDVDALGRFSLEELAPQPGLHTYTVEAIDAAGNVGTTSTSVLYGSFGTGALTDSLLGSVGPRALDSIALAVERQLEALDLDALVRAQGPIAETLRIEAVRRGGISVALVPTRAGIEVGVDVEGIEVDLRYEGLWDADISVRARRASVGATLRPGLAPDGGIDVDLEDPVASIEGFELDVSGVGGEEILRDEVRDALEAELVRLLREQVPPRLADQIATIDLPWVFPVGERSAASARLTRLGADRRGLFLARCRRARGASGRRALRPPSRSMASAWRSPATSSTRSCTRPGRPGRCTERSSSAPSRHPRPCPP